MSGTSSTTPPLYGVDTSLTPEQRKAYEEIGAALEGDAKRSGYCVPATSRRDGAGAD